MMDDPIRALRVRSRRWRARRRERDLAMSGWYDASARSDDRAIFIGGCGRSGTTLLKEIIARHPAVACGPETSMFGLPFTVENIGPMWGLDVESLRRRQAAARNLVEFSTAFFQEMAASEGKPRWADKTPNNVRALPRLLTWFPRGVFLHIVRDGRDVACSLRHHPKQRVVGGRVVPVTTNRPMVECATRWLEDTSKGLAFAGHPRVMTLRYESLVGEPERTARAICDFIGEPFDEAMLGGRRVGDARPGEVLNNDNAKGAIESGSIGRWKRDLSLAERGVVRDVAGELLIAMGYAADHAWADGDG